MKHHVKLLISHISKFKMLLITKFYVLTDDLMLFIIISLISQTQERKAQNEGPSNKRGIYWKCSRESPQ